MISSPLPTALAVAVLAWAAPAAAQHPWSQLSPEMQITLAVQAGPAEMRDGATVQGYDRSGAYVTLREGTNDLICMAPNPASSQFEVSCHHGALEPFFVRGRELTAAGITGQERVLARWREYEDGTLAIPYGAVNHILTGSGFDATTGAIADPYLRWTVYTPMATPATTGITDQAGPGPWLMFPGTAGSHIMITPPRGGGQEE